jgi:hypothetical protein
MLPAVPRTPIVAARSGRRSVHDDLDVRGCEARGRIVLLRAVRHDHQHRHLGPQEDVVAGAGDAFRDDHLAVFPEGHPHEEIDVGDDLRRCQLSVLTTL